MARQPEANTENRASSRRVGALAELGPFIRPYRRLVMLAGSGPLSEFCST